LHAMINMYVMLMLNALDANACLTPRGVTQDRHSRRGVSPALAEWISAIVELVRLERGCDLEEQRCSIGRSDDDSRRADIATTTELVCNTTGADATTHAST
jgi:hypothetical protein